MDSWLLMQQAELLRIYIEVEGCKAANKEREMNGQALAYPESIFVDAAKEVQGICDNIQQNR